MSARSRGATCLHRAPNGALPYFCDESYKHFAPTEQRHSLLELFQKPYIVLEKQTYVVKLVHQGAHAIDTETKSETRILLRIDTNSAQDIRMHHAGTNKLDPA